MFLNGHYNFDCNICANLTGTIHNTTYNTAPDKEQTYIQILFAAPVSGRIKLKIHKKHIFDFVVIIEYEHVKIGQLPLPF